MSRIALNYVFAMMIVVLILVIVALVQNWWDARHGR